MIDFKPSQVVLTVPCPLTNVYNKSELEFAAALIIRACVRNGDTWQPVGPEKMMEALKADAEENRPLASVILTNPFARPDFERLVAKGFAQYTEEDHEKSPIAFTIDGLERLRKWVKP